MERLCDAVFADSEGLSSDALRLNLQQRLHEYRTFELYRHRYAKICDWIPSPEFVQGKRSLSWQFSVKHTCK